METEIISAIQKGYFQQVRLLVKSRLNVNARDSYRRTALIYCALVDDESWGVGLARTLIEAGARVYLIDRAGLGPLHYACILGRAALLRTYLAAADFDVNLADHLGNTALHYAAATGFLEGVETLLATCARYGYRIDALNRIGHSPLDMAVQNGHGQCAELIEEAKRRLQERRTLLRAVSVPDLASTVSVDGKWDSELSVRRLRVLRNRSEMGNSESNGQLNSTACSNSCSRPSNGTCASSGTSDTSGSSSSTSTGSRSKSARLVSGSGLTPNGWTHSKSWSASLKKSDGDVTGRSNETVSRRDDRSTPVSGYEWVIIRRLRSLRPICAAPAKDPRSNPAKILGQNPSDLFASSENRQLAQPANGTNNNWRSTMNGLYDSFYFQFSTTYRSPVRREAYSAAAAAAADPGCPNESVQDGGELRRRQSVRKTSALRRTSVGKFAGIGDLPTPARRRKSSGVFLQRPQRRQSQQTSASGGSSDRPTCMPSV